jgi:hypothetical protein
MTLCGDADFSVFFNPEEFAVEAIIRGCVVEGMRSIHTHFSNGVETQTVSFITTCDAVGEIAQGERLLMEGQCYAVVGMQPDGTGLTTVLLEKLN